MILASIHSSPRFRHLAVVLLVCWAAAGLSGSPVEVGVAQIDITPQTPIRLMGFPNPTRQAEIAAVTQPLKAKAMVIGADQEQPVLLMVVDLIGVSERMRSQLVARLSGHLRGFDRSRFTLTATHNHSGPEIDSVLPYIFNEAASPEEKAHVRAYAPWLLDRLVEVAETAWANRRPATLGFTQGTVDFAVNRRVMAAGQWTGFGENFDGPVDHDLPLLVIKNLDGSLRVLWLNYACHAVSWLEPSVHSDWTGQVGIEIAARHPGVITLATAGCGADQNPIGLREKQTDIHARAMAAEVERLLGEPQRPIAGVPVVRYRNVELPLDPPVAIETWTKPKHRYRQVVLDQLARGETLDTTMPYMVQTWSFGEDLALVFLPGEVVVDYVLRLKRELKADRLWVTAYANALPGYIPSARLLPEGGYEVDGSRVYYGVPARIAPAAEDLIVEAVHDLLPAAFVADPLAAAAAKNDEWWKNNGHPRGAWWKNNKSYQGAEAEEIWERVKRPPAPVRTPTEALDTFLLPEGFRLELVAAEPLITRPVFMRFDAAGRLWVVEMNGYMRDVDATGESDPSGRVVVLEDEDGDGRMDKSTPFMDGLVMPRTLAFVPGGVLVVEPPRIWFAEDTDGDLKADRRTLVADDYGTSEGPEHSANGLLPTLDNWMYSAKSGVRYRFAANKLVAEPTVFRGQWGLTQDDSGRLFYNYNSSPLHADLVPGQYLATEGPTVRPPRAPGNLPELVNVSVADDFSVSSAHVTPLVTLGASDLNEDGTLKKYSAACAPLIYRGDLFPAAYRGNAFVCDPVGNLVGRFVVQGDATDLQARVAREAEREFLISTDERFRPVHLETGPDGSLYIADMYTGIIEHRMFVTEYLRNQTIERGFNQVTETGRIYRLVPEDAAVPQFVTLAGLSSAELVTHLAHPNGWVRDTAQRLLVERSDRSVLPALRRMGVTHSLALARLHALWTLDGLGDDDTVTLIAALGDPEATVRAAAVRISEVYVSRSRPDLVRAFRAVGHDADTGVKLQLMLSLGQVGEPWALVDIADLMAETTDPLFASAAMVALQGQETAFLEFVGQAESWQESSAGRADVIQLLAESVVKRGDQMEQVELGQVAVSLAAGDWRLTALQAGMKSGQPKSTAKAAPALNEAQQRLFKIGETRYTQICIACHQADGQGLANVAPALVGSRRATTNPEAAIRIVLHGLKGESLSMAGFGSIPGLMDDEAVAGVLTYVRRSWGHGAEPISPQQVAAVRAATKDRTTPWSETELEAWLEPQKTSK